MNISPFLSVNQSCGKALQWTQTQLSQAGLRSVRTFDLHTARAGLHDCPCPNHGTEDCDCQMVILLVYGKADDVSTPLNTSPATLFLHGNDGQTWLSIADSPLQRADPKLIAGIRQALNAPVSIPQDA
jgi:hypothetical protein